MRFLSFLPKHVPSHYRRHNHVCTHYFLQKRALKLQQQRQKEALQREQVRERELEKERLLIAKPVPKKHSSEKL